MTPTGQVFAGPLFYGVVLLAVWAVWAGVVTVLIRVASGHPQGMARPFFFLASLMAGMIFYFWRGGDFQGLTNPAGTQPGTAPDPSAVVTPTGTPSASASAQTKPAADPGLDVHVPWAKIGAVTGAVLLVVALIVLTVFLVRRHTRKTAAGAVRARLLRSLQGRHDKVLRDWVGFETDLVAVFEAPLLTDVTVPQTAAFTGAYGEAEHCRVPSGTASRRAGRNRPGARPVCGHGPGTGKDVDGRAGARPQDRARAHVPDGAADGRSGARPAPAGVGRGPA